MKLFTALICVVLLASSAVANPFYLGRFSGLRTGPLDDGPFAVYWNPGNLAVPGFSAQLSGLGVLRHATYDRDAQLNQIPAELQEANSGKNEVNGRGVVPSLALAYGRTSKHWAVGFGLTGFIDRSGVGMWEKKLDAPSDTPGAVDGPQRFSTISTRLIILSAGAGMGVEYRPAKLRFGLTVVGNFASLSTSRARNPDTSERTVDEAGRLAEGRILVEDSRDETFALILGAYWQPSSWFDLGLSWHSGVRYRLVGPTALVFGLAEPTTVESALALPVPETYRLETRFQLTNSIALRPMFVYSPWSVLKRQTATNTANDEVLFSQARNFRDLYSVRLVTDFRATERTTLHGGLSLENGVTPQKNFEPGLAESDNVEISLGITVELGPKLASNGRSRWRVGLTASWQEFADVTVTNSPQTPPTNGTYTDRRHFLVLDLEYRN